MKPGTFLLTLLLGLVLLIAAPSLAQPPSELTIYFYQEGQAVPVTRASVLSGDPQADAETLLGALVAGPTPEERGRGLSSPLPSGTELVAVTVSGDQVVVDLHVPLGFLRGDLDPFRSDAIVEQVVKTVHPLGLHRVHVRAEDEWGKFVPVSSFLPAPPVVVPTVPPNDDAAPDRPGSAPAPEHDGQPPGFGQGQPQGALTGKTVWLSAGHGWYWSSVLNRWTTQRGNNYGLVEDFSNAEAVNYYLARYLWNAGADVWFVRERAMSGHEIIVDNNDGAPAYIETGTWATSNWPGYNGGTYRYAISNDELSATATWTPDLPEAGWYAVWAWYQHGTNRASDVRYEIQHTGGVTTISISQEVHGQTWYYLGEYRFDAGMLGHVTLLNESDDPGQAIIADAVRFGGGLGSIEEPGGTSGEPRWEEAAKYWVRYQGAPPEIYGSDVIARPLYAEWESAKGYPGEAENAVYVSWHTNAGRGTGSESYIHNTELPTGSIELQDWIHPELISDLRAAWDPAWVNRGQKTADFGEVRELSIIPGVLLEVAFHDTEDPGDADDLREPVFRQIAARAVFQGIVKYHADREGTPVHLLPEPPERLVARNTGPGEVTLTWAPPPCCDGVVGDAATAYKVYQSADGRAFDNGTETIGPSLTMAGLPLGTLRFFRVTALNEGGESFPTPVVAVHTPQDSGLPAFLVVDGFDRLDQEAMIPQWEASFLGTAQRMFLERMNRYDYAVEHGGALATCGEAFDGAVNEAVEAGDVSLGDYRAVDWFVGKDSVVDAALSDVERALLRTYLEAGGRLLISGSEIGYDLVENGRDPTFYHDYLQANYLGDDASTYHVAGVPGGFLDGWEGSLDDSTQGTYDVAYPDRLAETITSTLVLTYAGGTADGAAVGYNGDFRVIYFGFPLETVTDPLTRTTIFCTAADYLLLPEGPEPPSVIPRLINPGFEQGLGQSAWQVSAPDGNPVFHHLDDLPSYIEPHGGNWLAWVGGHTPGITATTALTQVVALPSGDPTATLTLSWFAHSELTTPSVTDTLSVGIYDLSGTLRAELLTVNNQLPTGTWQTEEFDLSSFVGQVVQVAFHTVSSDTAFFADNVNLTTIGLPGPDEFRALWVDAYHDGIKTRRQIDELVETAQAGSFNALVVQIRRRGDTYYPSLLDPWAPDADPNFDALAYLVQRAHAVGIEVHAWAATLAIWGGDTPPDAPDHTFNVHGPGATGRDYWLMTSYAGEDQPGNAVYYLDPGHPDVVEYTVAIYAELAANYDLDGLHLDRIRYPESQGTYCQDQDWYCQDWGYNPTSMARFQEQTGRVDVPDPLDEAWIQWRRDQVTALVRRIYLTVTAIDPQLRVSAALSTVGYAPTDSYGWETRSPYRQQLQDWRGWLEEGIVDLALPMTYRRDDVSPDDFDNWIAWEKDHQYGRGTVVGTGLFVNTVQDSMDQWLRVRQASPLGYYALGMCGYSYSSNNDEGLPRRDFVNAAVTQVFTQSASVPATPWKDAPALGHLMGALIQPNACRNVDGHLVALTGPLSRTLLADGGGWFGAVDLPPGEYWLSAEVLTPTLTVTQPVTIVAGTITEQDIILPPCGSRSIYLPVILKHMSP